MIKKSKIKDECKRKRTGQARVGLARQGLSTKIGGLFLKFKLSLARALSSDSSLELAALMSNYPFKAFIF